MISLPCDVGNQPTHRKSYSQVISQHSSFKCNNLTWRHIISFPGKMRRFGEQLTWFLITSSPIIVNNKLQCSAAHSTLFPPPSAHEHAHELTFHFNKRKSDKQFNLWVNLLLSAGLVFCSNKRMTYWRALWNCWKTTAIIYHLTKIRFQISSHFCHELISIARSWISPIPATLFCRWRDDKSN